LISVLKQLDQLLLSQVLHELFRHKIIILHAWMLLLLVLDFFIVVFPLVLMPLGWMHELRLVLELLLYLAGLGDVLRFTFLFFKWDFVDELHILLLIIWNAFLVLDHSLLQLECSHLLCTNAISWLLSGI